MTIAQRIAKILLAHGHFAENFTVNETSVTVRHATYVGRVATVELVTLTTIEATKNLLY